MKRSLWLLPPLLCLLYASLLLAARHLPEVREHWQALVQAPRIVVGASALLVVMWGRRKDEGPDVAAEPLPAAPQRAPGPECDAPAARESPKDRSRSPLLQSPSLLIGLLMAGSAALLVVGGRWGEASWGQVQVGAAAAWVAAGVVGWWAGRRG